MAEPSRGPAMMKQVLVLNVYLLNYHVLDEKWLAPTMLLRRAGPQAALLLAPVLRRPRHSPSLLSNSLQRPLTPSPAPTSMS